MAAATNNYTVLRFGYLVGSANTTGGVHKTLRASGHSVGKGYPVL
jgi:hypothetical protein